MVNEFSRGTEDVKVTVVIPSYNRYDMLLEAIESVSAQTHKNFEVIVINDASTEEAYYKNRHPGVSKWIDLKTGGKEKFGHVAPGYVRNFGIKEATGEFIAFLDDDDLWFPNKTTIQLRRMMETGCEMSCTEGYIGNSFEKNKNYYIYNREFYRWSLKRWEFDQITDILNSQIMQKHNIIIQSSVIMKKKLIDKIGFQTTSLSRGEDYDFWKRALVHTDCVQVNEPLIFYRAHKFLVPTKRSIVIRVLLRLRRGLGILSRKLGIGYDKKN